MNFQPMKSHNGDEADIAMTSVKITESSRSAMKSR